MAKEFGKVMVFDYSTDGNISIIGDA